MRCFVRGSEIRPMKAKHEVQLDSTDQMDTQVYSEKKERLECGPMPNAMVALPNTGGALCSVMLPRRESH